MDIYNLNSLLGLVALMVFAWLVSADRKNVNWRVIIAGCLLQLAMGFIVFWMPGSKSAFLWLNDAVMSFINAATLGQIFVFGSLGGGNSPTGFVLAFQSLPLVIFFSALMGLLYYIGLMPLIIRGFAYVFTVVMRVSGAESLCTASNIFVGVESVTAIRPYLSRMTRSEFCTILTAGMATVASSTMAIYVIAMKDTFPTIAGHLISASFLSAPAALLVSKIVLPEGGQPETLGKHIHVDIQRDEGWIDSIVSGAMAGVKLVVGIVALLIAFMGMVGVVNMILGGVGGWFGCQWSLQGMLGYIFYPFAIAMGVPSADALEAGRLLGQRLIVTEIPAYQQLAGDIQAGSFTSGRTPVLLAYALCGFAHIASLAIFVGGVAFLVPDRKKDIVAAGPRALLAATLACLMTGAIAGVFYHDQLTVLASHAAATMSASVP